MYAQLPYLSIKKDTILYNNMDGTEVIMLSKISQAYKKMNDLTHGV